MTNQYKLRRQTAGIHALRAECMELSCVKFNNLRFKEKVLGQPPACPKPLRRYLSRKNLYQARTSVPRKRFTVSSFGELSTSDFLHGPHVVPG